MTKKQFSTAALVLCGLLLFRPMHGQASDNATDSTSTATATPSPSPTPDKTPRPSTDVTVVAGIGSLIQSTHTRYKVQNTNQVLEAENVGHATPQLLTGASFNLPLGNFHHGCWYTDSVWHQAKTALQQAKDAASDAQKADDAADQTLKSARDDATATDTKAAEHETTELKAEKKIADKKEVEAAAAKKTADSELKSKQVTLRTATEAEDKAYHENRSCLGGWNHIVRPWHAVATAQFAPNTSDVINGFVIGGAYRLSAHFAFFVGYALTPNDEPTPGFRNAAQQIVRTNNDPNNMSAIPFYKNFNADQMAANKPGAFDGFPLFVQNAAGPTTTPVFLGDPLVTHYRGGWVFGFTFPLSELSKVKPQTSQ